jgi:hypothetical protein
MVQKDDSTGKAESGAWQAGVGFVTSKKGALIIVAFIVGIIVFKQLVT